MPIRISAKTLGQLAMPDCCPRCFWIRHRLRWPTPVFPGIFSTIDSISKLSARRFFQTHLRPPPWFAGFGDVVNQEPTPHHSRFQVVDAPSDVLLTGSPDEICRCGDGTVVILDYKTSKHTTTQDSLMPLYQVQLNGYATIHERLQMGRVSGLGLVYFAPQIEPGLLNNGFLMQFFAQAVPVALDLSIIPPLLMEAGRICRSSRPPRSRVDCHNCERMGELVRLVDRRHRTKQRSRNA